MIMGDSGAVTIYLYSFSYKYGPPPQDDSGNGGGYVFDCRGLPNPYWQEELRPLNGREQPIVAFMASHPETAEYLEHCAGLVLASARVYAQRGYERLMTAFGCTGGKHRSVYMAEQLCARLTREGFRVELTHLARERWQEEPTP